MPQIIYTKDGKQHIREKREDGTNLYVLYEYIEGSESQKGQDSAEIGCLYDLIALYHFALQATVIEVNGINYVGNNFLHKQLDWLCKWRDQCERERS